LLACGLILTGLSLAPASPEPKPDLGPLEEARYQAALREYEETWAYYQQNRIDSYQVYVWSRIVLDSRRDLAKKPAEHIAAVEGHLDRMRRLESLIKKVRRLGFGRSYDVGASEYYRLEAELWVARAKSPK
jgi:hypothetical protein